MREQFVITSWKYIFQNGFHWFSMKVENQYSNIGIEIYLKIIDMMKIE